MKINGRMAVAALTLIGLVLCGAAPAGAQVTTGNVAGSVKARRGASCRARR